MKSRREDSLASIQDVLDPDRYPERVLRLYLSFALYSYPRLPLICHQPPCILSVPSILRVILKQTRGTTPAVLFRVLLLKKNRFIANDIYWSSHCCVHPLVSSTSSAMGLEHGDHPFEIAYNVS